MRPEFDGRDAQFVIDIGVGPDACTLRRLWLWFFTEEMFVDLFKRFAKMVAQPFRLVAASMLTSHLYLVKGGYPSYLAQSQSGPRQEGTGLRGVGAQGSGGDRFAL